VAVTPDGSRIVTGSSDKTARVWDAHTGAELLQLTGHDGFVFGVAVTPDGSRIMTGSGDKTARVWDAHTGAELFRAEGQAGAIRSVAVTPDGSRVVTGSTDRTAFVWALAQLRPRQVQHESHTREERQAVVDQGKMVVPRCLTIEERQTYLLAPKPPAWCIDMEKYPYNTAHWKAWEAGRKEEALDPYIAFFFGDFANTALIQGDFDIALDAAKLGLEFDPGQYWILINRAEANMFLGRLQEARDDYLSHVGEKVTIHGRIQGQWEECVLQDFQTRRREGRDEPLMTEVEQLFKPSPPVKGNSLMPCQETP
jgi:hypothetical protein